MTRQRGAVGKRHLRDHARRAGGGLRGGHWDGIPIGRCARYAGVLRREGKAGRLTRCVRAIRRERTGAQVACMQIDRCVEPSKCNVSGRYFETRNAMRGGSQIDRGRNSCMSQRHAFEIILPLVVITALRAHNTGARVEESRGSEALTYLCCTCGLDDVARASDGLGRAARMKRVTEGRVRRVRLVHYGAGRLTCCACAVRRSRTGAWVLCMRAIGGAEGI